MAKTNTFEVAIVNGGTVLKTSDMKKAERVFEELAAYMYPDRVFLQTWNGYKLISERISNTKEN